MPLDSAKRTIARASGCLVRYIAGLCRDGHTPVEDVEGKPIRAADDGPDRAPKDRDFFGAIKAKYFERTATSHARRENTGAAWRAAGVCGVHLSATIPTMALTQLQLQAGERTGLAIVDG
jgi:hypothetical protein